METYVGLADCHGVESFKRLSDCPANWTALLGIRAMSNDQRHAVTFKVDLTEEQAKQITYLLEHNDFIAALVVLKMMPNVLIQEGFSGRWNNIPNPMLDPWWEGRPIKNERNSPRKLD